MSKRSFLLAAAAVLAPVAATAQVAVPVPSIPMPTIPSTGCPAYPARLTSPIARVIINGVCFDLSNLITVTIPGKVWNLTMTSPLQLGGAQVQLRGLVFDADPTISFPMTTINLPDDVNTFVLLTGTPVVPGFYTSASSDLRVSITSGVNGSASVAPATALQPPIVAAFGTLANLGSNLGVNIGTSACSVGPGLPGLSTSCDYGVRTNTFDPVFLDNLEAQVSYTQTGLGSVATITGSVNLFPAQAPGTVVPEPATVALVATGLAGLALVGRRKRTASA